MRIVTLWFLSEVAGGVSGIAHFCWRVAPTLPPEHQKHINNDRRISDSVVVTVSKSQGDTNLLEASRETLQSEPEGYEVQVQPSQKSELSGEKKCEGNEAPDHMYQSCCSNLKYTIIMKFK